MIKSKTFSIQIFEKALSVPEDQFTENDKIVRELNKSKHNLIYT